MSGVKRLMVDSNIVVMAVGGNSKMQRHLNKAQIFISIITEIELLSIRFRDAEHEFLLRDFIRTCVIIPIGDDVKEMSAQIRKKWKTKLPDAIIAASAIVHELDFLTADRGFNRIESIDFKLNFLQP